MADLTIAGSLSATGTVEVRPVRANLLDEAGRLVPPVVVPASPAFSVKVPEVPGAVYRIRGYNSQGKPGDQAFTTKTVSGLVLKVPAAVAAPGGGGAGGGGGPAYDDTALKARVAAVESGKLDKAEAAQAYATTEGLNRLGGLYDGLNQRITLIQADATDARVSADNAEAAVEELKTQVGTLQQDNSAFLKGLILGPDDLVPPGTPSGYVIVRKSE